MYRWVPGGLHDAGPNPQPALPQRLHFCSSSSSLLRTYCFWPRLSCTELGCILLFSFSPGDSLDQSPGSLFGSSAASFLEARGFARTRLTTGLPFSQRFSKEDAPTTSFIIRFSGISRQHISESPCLGAELPLLTELPRRVLLGNWASGNVGSRKFIACRIENDPTLRRSLS